MQGAPKRKGSGSQALTTGKRARFWDDVLGPSASESCPTSSGLSMVSGVHTANINGSILTMVGRDSNTTNTTNTTIHNHYSPVAVQIDILGILNSLGLPRFRDIQLDTLAKGTNGTCLWLTTGEMFLIWVERGVILWGIGIPGAGKTILASIVIHYLEQLEKGSGGAICVAYVYLRYSEPLSLRDILESLVKQILERHEDLLPLAGEIYAKHKRERTRLSQDELTGLLERFASLKTIFFVLDALDELRERDQPVLVGILASLNAKLFITSRPLPTLQPRFPQAQMFNIVADPSDIKLLVQDTFHESPALMALIDGSGLEDEIIETICQKAGGMFLHARLQLEALRHCINILDVEETLEEFPVEIEGVYAKTWERILAQPPKHANLAKLVFLWILCAQREPTIDLLRRMVSTCPQTHIYQPKRLVPEALLVSVCCGLVTVDPKTQHVRLVHYTTKDAILPRIQGLYPCPHAIPTLVCVTHLTGAGFQNVEDDDFDLWSTLELDPLLQYAHSVWHHHAHQCAQHESTAIAVTSFVRQCIRYPFFDKVNDIDFLGALHVAAVYGFDDLIIETRQSHSPNTYTPIYGFSPLNLACQCGTSSSVKALLSLPGTDINAANKLELPPLIDATLRGDLEIVNVLLAVAGIDVNALDSEGDSALMCAASYGFTEIVKLLLNTPGINPCLTASCWHDGERSALTLAFKAGHMDIVKLLEAFESPSCESF